MNFKLSGIAFRFRVPYDLVGLSCFMIRLSAELSFIYKEGATLFNERLTSCLDEVGVI